MLSAGDISVGEALEKNSKEQNLRKSSGQLLDCNRIFYRIFHHIVGPCTRVRNRHGGVIRSAAVAEASIFRESKAGSNILE